MSKKKKYVMVEAIQQYRMRYVVELDADSPDEYALDTVAVQEAIEFSQKDLGETIVSHRKISKNEFIKIFKEDHDYLSEIDDERCLEIGLTKIKEE